MAAILEPTVLISILFSLLIALFSRRLSKFGEQLISYISSSPNKFHNYVVRQKWKSYRKVINAVRGQHQITLSIVRTYSFLIVFLIVMFTYLYLIIFGALKGFGELPSSVQLFIASPIYVFEVLWLMQKEKMLFLIRVAEKRVTIKSNGTAKKRQPLN